MRAWMMVLCLGAAVAQAQRALPRVAPEPPAGMQQPVGRHEPIEPGGPRLALQRELETPWSWSQWWMAGGPLMYVIAVLAGAAVVAALLHLLVRSRGTLIGGALLAVIAFGAGATGRWLGRRAVNTALKMIQTSDAELIRQLGYREAAVPLQLGLTAAIAAAVLLATGELLRRRTPSAGDPPA